MDLTVFEKDYIVCKITAKNGKLMLIKVERNNGN